jgi:hypothetical protein
MNRPAIPPEKESTAQQFVLPDGTGQEDPHPGHLQMIPIGGAIGVGRAHLRLLRPAVSLSSGFPPPVDHLEERSAPCPPSHTAR